VASGAPKGKSVSDTAYIEPVHLPSDTDTPGNDDVFREATWLSPETLVAAADDSAAGDSPPDLPFLSPTDWVMDRHWVPSVMTHRAGNARSGGHAAVAVPPCASLATLTRVLMVDDDETHCAALSHLLRPEGFEVHTAPTGATAMKEVIDSGAELILLDLVLPDGSGTELCRALRQRCDVPIIMVTSRSSEIDRIVALELGADDYVTKPYSPRELVARMRAVLRRWRRPATEEEAPVLAAGPVRIDVDKHLVTIRDAVIRLPLKEFELLELLLRNAGRVLTRRQIIERVWGADYVGDTKTLDTHVRRLRRRVEPVPSRPRHLVTVRGMGFRFQP
jgi:two-component system response regulator RegX3